MSENKDDLKNKLTPEEYYVTQNHGTEPAFSGEFDKNYAPGTYCLLYTSPSPRDLSTSRMPSSA